MRTKQKRTERIERLEKMIGEYPEYLNQLRKDSPRMLAWAISQLNSLERELVLVRKGVL